jgi:hypothetical protein
MTPNARSSCGCKVAENDVVMPLNPMTPIDAIVSIRPSTGDGTNTNTIDATSASSVENRFTTNCR